MSHAQSLRIFKYRFIVTGFILIIGFFGSYLYLGSSKYCTYKKKPLVTEMYNNIRRVSVSINSFQQVMMDLFQPYDLSNTGITKENIFSEVQKVIVQSRYEPSCTLPLIELDTTRRSLFRTYMNDERGTLSIAIDIIVSADGRYATVKNARWRPDIGFFGLQRYYDPSGYFSTIEAYSSVTSINLDEFNNDMKQRIARSFPIFKRPSHPSDLVSQ